MRRKIYALVLAGLVFAQSVVPTAAGETGIFDGEAETSEIQDADFADGEVLEEAEFFSDSAAADTVGSDGESSVLASGTCGDSASWSLTSDGTLTISGEGAMDETIAESFLPSYYVDFVKKAIIEEGITGISGWAFFECENLSTVTIPESVTEIGQQAFAYSGLEEITIPSGVQTIEVGAFETNTLTGFSVEAGNEQFAAVDGVLFSKNLTRLVAYPGGKAEDSYEIPEGTKEIAKGAFYQVNGLKTVTVASSVEKIEEAAFGEMGSYMTGIYFKGDCPTFESSSISSSKVFYYTTTILYYPDENATWDDFDEWDAGSDITLAIWNPDGKISLAACEIALAETAFTYDGEEKRPAVTVKSGDAVLAENTDYTLSYENNVNAGTATVAVTGAGGYYKTVKETFTIAKADQSLSAELSSVQIAVDETARITAAGIGTLSYSSADTSVAEVDSNGTVTGIGEGKTVITVEASGSENYNSASVGLEVSVTEGTLSGITPTPTVTPTASSAVTPTVTPAASSAVTPTVTPAASSAVTPTVTPAAASTVTPTVTAAPTPTSVPASSGQSAECSHQWTEWTVSSEATVFAAEIQTRTCSKCGKEETQTSGTKLAAAMNVNVSGTLPLKTKQKLTKVTVTGLANGDYVKSWKSSNTKIVKVTGKSDGTCTITAQKKTGKATVTITLASGLTKKINVKVQKAKVTTKKITGVSSKLTLKKGESLKLSVTLNPISSTDKITYKTSNKKVAAVSSGGVIKAKKKGTATITIKAGKKTKKIKVTVK